MNPILKALLKFCTTKKLSFEYTIQVIWVYEILDQKYQCIIADLRVSRIF